MRYDQFVLGSSEGKKLNDCDLCTPPHMNNNTPVSSYDGVTSLCMCSSVNEGKKVYVFVRSGTNAV